MIHFDLPKEKSSIIKVIGVGGGGSNAVNHMYSQNIEGVNFIICNTDAQAIAQSSVPNKVQLGPHLTQGLGAGANPEIGRQATEESLEEIRRILEVNTKMAFVTAGMGGGTGTGGAPIIAKICRDLGVLTVGIVTTPFAYEGKKRQQQAMDGINTLKNYVDTLLVISNDKLRHQFGNLKMREAFEKADNVLATAAKCITDVINSTGQINVDFADVCTVMKNGGSAILGSAATSGENRAQKAIEEALNSPLLNDNDIRGAKWILININSAEGEHEFTMDEVEIIQTHLMAQAGEDTDVILGLGYDNNLGEKIGITLIATGFQHKEIDLKPEATKAQPQEDKIVMVLNTEPEVPVAQSTPVAPKPVADPLAPAMKEEESGPQFVQQSLELFSTPPVAEEKVVMPLRMEWDLTEEKQTAPQVAQPQPAPQKLQPEVKAQAEPEVEKPVHMQIRIKDENPDVEAEKKELEKKKEWLDSRFEELRQSILGGGTAKPQQNTDKSSPSSAAAGGYLARPSNIYSENQPEVSTSNSAEEPVRPPVAKVEPEESFDMQLVVRNDIPAADKPVTPQEPQASATHAEDFHDGNDAAQQQRRMAERLQKLRNLSFNLNAADPNNEFDTVPAYIRRNMELYNTASTVENFYSNYTVKPEGKNSASISTINTFLDGKKPD